MVDSINMGSKNLFSIVIPVFNGEKTVEELCLKIDAVFKNMHRDYEIILVDDGSPDDSWETIKKIKGHHSNVRAFRLARNFGQHNAIMCGFNYARGEYVITID
ncbi:MAG: glycosyltransferase, partial [Candidatus Saganbacteria bacterium]|nr:glycosyltransferase [Candidatus Saganbacteria bacterium]